MKFHQYETLKKAKRALSRRGYRHQFDVKNKLLINKKSKQVYLPNELKIIEYHRFNNKKEVNEKTLVFVVEFKDKTKGIVISTYGDYSDMPLIKFMDKVKIKLRSTSIATS